MILPTTGTQSKAADAKSLAYLRFSSNLEKIKGKVDNIYNNIFIYYIDLLNFYLISILIILL